MQSVHLGLTFDIADVKVSDLTVDSVQTALATYTNGSNKLTRNSAVNSDAVAALLVKYAHVLERTHSIGDAAVVPYLLLIRNPETRRSEIASLIAHGPAGLVDDLTGKPDQNGYGQRQDCRLDTYLSKDEVSSILEAAAMICKKQSADTAMAKRSATLYLLAGRNSSLLRLLNELISPPEDLSDFKTHWADESKKFYDQYLTTRTAVLDQLEREDMGDLIFSLVSLLKLRQFFVTLHGGNFEAALESIARMGLLPNSEAEVDEKASKYHDLDRNLQLAFPTAIVATVKCLHELYGNFKSQPQSSSPTGLARLKE